MKNSSVVGRIVCAVLSVSIVGLSSAKGGTLEDCIGTALRNNPDLRAATERVQVARAAIREAQSAYYPMLGASVAYARTDNPPQAFMMLLNQRNVSMQSDFNNPPDTDNLALSLGVRYRLFDFGRRGLDEAMAQGGAEVSRLVLQGLQNELIHQVTRGYYSALQAGAFVQVREESVGTLEESLRVANERLKAGGTVKTDVLNLEVQLAQAKEDLIRARNGVKLALVALNTAMGTNRVSASDLVVAADPVVTPPPEQEEASVIRHRPEFRAARKGAELQAIALKKARRDYWPTVSAFGAVDWNSDVSSDFERSYNVGVMAELNVFDGFRRSAAAAGAGAQQRAAEAEAVKAEDNLRLDLTASTLQAGEAWERLEVARKSIESAAEALRMTQQRYQQGAADVPDLLTAQVGLTAIRTRKVAALYDYLIALSNLQRARGELVQRYAGSK